MSHGTYVDWDSGQNDKNRAKLFLLDPTKSPGNDVIAELTGDSSFPSPRDGIGACVFGVKIDDVNNNGTKEIWCCDQLHLYLFYKDATLGWRVATRTADIGCFPGCFNNIFPIKNDQNQTVKLIVASPGYVMEFTVNPGLVP